MEITKLEQLDLSKVYSYADYFTWKFSERVELLKGKIFAMSPAPNSRHQDISQFLNFKLYSFLLKKPCKVYQAPFDVRLDKTKNDKKIKTVVQPDICVICDLSKLDGKGCMGAPELVIEILSPGNSNKELKLKYDLYEENGVLEYWIVDPERESIHQYIAIDGKFIPQRPFVKGDKIKSAAIKGFTVQVTEIFE